MKQRVTRWLVKTVASSLVPVVAVILAIVVLIAVVAAVFSMAGKSDSSYSGGGGNCRITPDALSIEMVTGDRTYERNTADPRFDQLLNAAIILQVGAQKGLGQRDQIIALMTAIQESNLENLPWGDRDSKGLYQQRPSMGWGTDEQVQDPYYASGTFYDHLTALTDRDSMSLNDAAQAVQHSGYPDAYGPHQADAEAIRSAIYADTSAVSCTVSGGLTLAQAQDLMDTYKVADNVQWGVFSCGCTGGCMVNCVSFSIYFVNRFTNSWITGATGNGRDVASTLINDPICGGASCGLTDGGHTPAVYAIFSRTTGPSMCGNAPCGHTGVVLGIDADNDQIIIGEAGCGDPGFTGAHTYRLSDWSTTDYQYAYTDTILKGDPNAL